MVTADMDSGVPACCEGCDEHGGPGAGCRLLAEPTLEHRHRLLTMPCDVQRLVRLRFRGYGEDVAAEALVAWLSPAWAAEDVVRSFGHAPRDARLWLGAWPYLYLGRDAVRRLHRERERAAAAAGSPPEPPASRADPHLATRVLRALDKVRRVDAVGYAMLLEFVRDRFSPSTWQKLLACSEATVTDRKYLGIYRYAVYFHEVLESVEPHEAAVALSTRRFAPGEPGDRAALEATRAALADPGLGLAAWRSLYREGALHSLALLAAPEALGSEVMSQVSTAFRRVLRVD